jgi:hypothetical protein
MYKAEFRNRNVEIRLRAVRESNEDDGVTTQEYLESAVKSWQEIPIWRMRLEFETQPITSFWETELQ